MRQVRIHGRGGQGVVTAAEMLARAGFLAGHEVQAIPSFGSERTGAPVVSYCRFDDAPLRTREPVLAPDVVLVQDPTLLATGGVFAGLAPGGLVIVDTTTSAHEVRAAAGAEDVEATVVTVPATSITLRHLGRPKPAAAMLAAYAASADDVTLEAVEQVFRARFPGAVGEANAAAAQESFAFVRDELTGMSEAETAAASTRED
ncbi:2-oxoacid:acceptor oxidoreductase family protein [Demequina mangrovi]|uniref:Pyruvate ferredoxin oxidoreductase gamma subunit n=1 Tax=Demequina mangrovi TaxID=1043493 RepID=A0A1H6UR24_9MICO|nr:2-oxoacid:acceptor oxidoreductase family protein [Demequina mangrovi]SEI94721.1 pyruvate ferredoxin oxidoreductase gamma subunit [Demequina mangrovi]